MTMMVVDGHLTQTWIVFSATSVVSLGLTANEEDLPIHHYHATRLTGEIDTWQTLEYCESGSM